MKKIFMTGSAFALISLLGACANESGTGGTDSTATNSGSGDTGSSTVVSDSNNVGAMEDYKAGDQFTATEPLTFSMMYSDHPNYPIKNDWLLFEKIKELTNVEFDMTVIPMSDYEQKRSLLISSGDSPYIIPKTYPGQESPFVSSGAILPVSDYIDLMPNFKDKIEKWDMESELNGLRQEDGKFYVLPGLHEKVRHDYTLALRYDIWDENNLEIPDTWEDLYESLKELKKVYPDRVLFSDRFKGNSLLSYAASSFGTIGGWGFNQGVVFNKEKDEFEYAPTTQNYKDMVAYFAKLVSEGLLDKETFTQEDDQAIQKLANEQSFVISTNSQNLIEYRTSLDATVGEGNYVINKITNPASSYGNIIGGARTENGIMISSKALEDEHFVAMMQFIDWLWYSDEGQEFAKWGVEGTTYTKDDEGNYKLTDDVNYIGMNPAGTKALNADFGFSGGVFAYGGTSELQQSMMSEEEKEFQDAMNSTRELAELAPPAPLPEDVREQYTLLATPLKDATDQATLQFILGNRSMDEYDQFVTELQGQGLDQFLQIVNEAYENYKAANE